MKLVAVCTSLLLFGPPAVAQTKVVPNNNSLPRSQRHPRPNLGSAKKNVVEMPVQSFWDWILYPGKSDAEKALAAVRLAAEQFTAGATLAGLDAETKATAFAHIEQTLAPLMARAQKQPSEFLPNLEVAWGNLLDDVEHPWAEAQLLKMMTLPSPLRAEAFVRSGRRAARLGRWQNAVEKISGNLSREMPTVIYVSGALVLAESLTQVGQTQKAIDFLLNEQSRADSPISSYNMRDAVRFMIAVLYDQDDQLARRDVILTQLKLNSQTAPSWNLQPLTARSFAHPAYRSYALALYLETSGFATEALQAWKSFVEAYPRSNLLSQAQRHVRAAAAQLQKNAEAPPIPNSLPRTVPPSSPSNLPPLPPTRGRP